jgi:hypothetical protein
MANSPKKTTPTAVTAVKGHLVTKSSGNLRLILLLLLNECLFNLKYLN